MYQTAEIEPMWLQDKDNLEDDPNISASRSVFRMPARIEPKDSGERFLESMVIAKKLCTVLGTSTNAQYAQRLQVLKDLFEIWSSGKEAAIMTGALLNI